MQPLAAYIDRKSECPLASRINKLLERRVIVIPVSRSIACSWFPKSNVGTIVNGLDGKPNFFSRRRDFHEMSLIFP